MIESKSWFQDSIMGFMLMGVPKSDIRPPKNLFFDFSSFSKLPKAARLMSVFPTSKNRKVELLSVQSSVLGTPLIENFISFGAA